MQLQSFSLDLISHLCLSDLIRIEQFGIIMASDCQNQLDHLMLRTRLKEVDYSEEFQLQFDETMFSEAYQAFISERGKQNVFLASKILDISKLERRISKRFPFAEQLIKSAAKLESVTVLTKNQLKEACKHPLEQHREILRF